jgi:lipopolysaccharide transport system ATP-binding protein
MSAAISVDGLGKQYRLGQRESYAALRDVIARAATAPLRRDRVKRERPTFWALEDVAFEVTAGEVIGVIGRNGAGKSTLLKILSRITEPTKGRVELRGRVGSLLEVGTGFHPELTGRENVYLNGAILGMRRAEIREKFDEIVEFSGIGKFLDTPVKRYSSGMYVRLAFSVAAHLEPEILLVDEVLSVGDAEFQRKCLGKMEDVTHHGRTVLFVSHNMAAIRKLCPRAILLDHGQVVADGPTPEVLTTYFDSIGSVGDEAAVVNEVELSRRGRLFLPQGEERFRLRRLEILDEADEHSASFRSSDAIRIRLTYDVFETITNLQLVFALVDQDGTVLLRTESTDEPALNQYYTAEPGRYVATCDLPADFFGEQRFYVTVHAILQGVQHVDLDQILHFDVAFEGYNDNLSVHSRSGYFRPRLAWTTSVSERTEAPL